MFLISLFFFLFFISVSCGEKEKWGNNLVNSTMHFMLLRNMKKHSNFLYYTTVFLRTMIYNCSEVFLWKITFLSTCYYMNKIVFHFESQLTLSNIQHPSMQKHSLLGASKVSRKRSSIMQFCKENTLSGAVDFAFINFNMCI